MVKERRPIVRAHLCKGGVDETLETDCTFRQFSPARRLLGARSKELVSDVEGDENREAERIARGRHVGRGAHLLLDVRGKSGDVPVIEGAADRVLLPCDFDEHHSCHRSDRLELFEHLGDARANQLAFVA